MNKVYVGLLVAILCVPLASASEPHLARFTRYDAGDFVIVTSRSSSQARQFIEDLAKFRITLEKMLGKRAANNAFPTTIVIANTSDWTNYLQPGQNIAGFFHGGRFSNYMAMNGDADRDQAVHVMFHEYTHYYLASQFSGEYPPWFNEGLAELMGYAMFNKGMAVLRIPMDQVYEARDRDWIPFDKLIQVSMSSPEYRSHKLAPAFYAQAWLTVHYGLVENRDFGRQMVKYLGQLNRLVPQEQAAHEAFGADLAVTDKLLRDYAHKSGMSSGGLSLGEVPEVTLPQGKPVSDQDTLAIVIDLMLEIRAAPDRVRPLVESLARREPTSARSAIFAARLAQLSDDNAGFDAAVNKAEAALAADDWLQRRELASVLLSGAIESGPMSSRNSEDSDRDLKRSFRWFGEAIAHNNQDVEALWGFGTTATRLNKNLDLAEQALLTAHQLAPASGDVAMSLANLKGRQDKPDEMIPYLKEAIRYSTNLGTREWAVQTLVQTQNYLVERDKVDAENKKQRDDYEKKLADYEKKYGKKKK